MVHIADGDSVLSKEDNMVDPEYYFAIKTIPWQKILKKFGLKIGFKKGRRGSTSLGIMKCPFHKEKHASLVFYEGGWFHCYGCGVRGDIFEFVREKLKTTHVKVFGFFNKNFGIPPPKFIKGY